MGHWPLPAGSVGHDMLDTGTSILSVDSCTASATPHVKGAWTQAEAAIPNGVKGIHMVVYSTAVAAANSSTLMDIGIGGAGSEVVVVENLNVGYKINPSQASWYQYIPLRLPNGVRLALRCQSATASKVPSVHLGWELGEGLLPCRSFGAVDTMGADTATSRGVTLTPNATINTPGAWAEVIASTARAYHALGAMVGGAGETVLVGQTWMMDIGIGGSGSEVVLVPNIPLRNLSTSEEMGQYKKPGSEWMADLHIPAGSRLSARVNSGVTGAANTRSDVVLYGFRR
jgi:hypothetical protein